MNSPQPNPIESQTAAVSTQPESSKFRPPQKKPLTFGQKVADKLATKVGSWAFLIGQTTILTGWVGCNLIPGLPRWDEAPFMMLNLVFSFASAYTAPVVLMSQNRQSEEDRESANHNYQITLQAAEKLELLHEKLDAHYAKKLDELSALIQQQQATNAAKVVVLPAQNLSEFEYQAIETETFTFQNLQPKKTVFVDAMKNLDEVEVRINS